MSKTERLNLRATESQFAEWQAAADRDEREVFDWGRRVLDIVAQSGLTVVELRKKLLPDNEEPEKNRGRKSR